MAERPQVTKEDDVWVIRIEGANGKVQEYRCATERQARQLALVLAPQPSALQR
jgi:hypothetical protein